MHETAVTTHYILLRRFTDMLLGGVTSNHLIGTLWSGWQCSVVGCFWFFFFFNIANYSFFFFFYMVSRRRDNTWCPLRTFADRISTGPLVCVCVTESDGHLSGNSKTPLWTFERILGRQFKPFLANLQVSSTGNKTINLYEFQYNWIFYSVGPGLLQEKAG